MRLFLAHQRRFYGLILSLVPHVADADDLLQETAALMWQKFSDFRPGTDFAAWGLRFARNVVSNYHRTRRRSAGRITFSEALLASVTDEVTEILDEVDLRHEALRKCLTKLPDRARRLLELRYEPGATGKRVAEQLGKSAESTYKALGRAHDALLRCVERTIAAEERP